jgi:hypothetical protein
MLSFSSVEDVILFHGVNFIIFEGLDVIIFHVIIWCYHLMLSFLTVCKCYHFCVIIFLVQDGRYQLCYHLMLSFFVIISTLFSFS